MTRTGTVIKVFSDHSAAFIKPDENTGDVFARRQEWINPPATFEPGTRVSFQTYRGPKGICAEQVRIIEDDGRHLDHGVIESTRPEYGFIRPDDNGPSVFVHKAECNFPQEIGQRVTYVLTADKSGRSRAAVCRKE